MDSPIRQLVNKRMAIVSWLAVLGVLISAFLVFKHFRPELSEFCNLSDYFNCDIVNKSIYAKFLGIPVSILGLGAYLVILLTALGVQKKWDFQKIHKWLRPGNVLKAIYWFSSIGLLFSLYLTYTELFILHAVCIFCVAQQIIIFIIFLILMVLRYDVAEDTKGKEVCEFC